MEQRNRLGMPGFAEVIQGAVTVEVRPEQYKKASPAKIWKRCSKGGSKDPEGGTKEASVLEHGQ